MQGKLIDLQPCSKRRASCQDLVLSFRFIVLSVISVCLCYSYFDFISLVVFYLVQPVRLCLLFIPHVLLLFDTVRFVFLQFPSVQSPLPSCVILSFSLAFSVSFSVSLSMPSSLSCHTCNLLVNQPQSIVLSFTLSI